jgi:hypothetical protein
LKSNNKYNIDDMAIDDEAGFAFNNGTIKGEGHKTGPGTEQTTATPGDTGAGAELGDGEDEVGPAELILGQVRTTWVLANDSKNEIFWLGIVCVDGDDGGDGYSPLGVFGLDGDDDGSSGGGDSDTHHYWRQADRVEDQMNRQAGRLGLTGAERR